MAPLGRTIAERQAHYYGDLFEKHGAGIDAVASGRQVYKDLRYERLAMVFARDESCSVHDVGFGLGHFYEFLKVRYPKKTISYSGSEVTPQFVEYSRKAYPEAAFYLRDLTEGPFPERYDYLIFAGMFYHLAGSSAAEFGEFTRQMLRNGFASANRGIAFNFVTGYVDYRYDDLFYGDLPEIIEFVSRNLSRFFTIDHATPLYEYTVCVYREEYLASVYSDDAFSKYFKCGR